VDRLTDRHRLWDRKISNVIERQVGTEANKQTNKKTSRHTNKQILRINLCNVEILFLYLGCENDEVSKQLLVAAIHQAKEFNHPNIVKPIGLVLNPIVQVVTPYMKCTNLNEFLRQHSDTVTHKQVLLLTVLGHAFTLPCCL